MYYKNQQAYIDLEKLMPSICKFKNDFQPNEEWWEWNGNNIHIDTFRNSTAKAKVILMHGVGTNGRQMSMLLGAFLAQNDYETIAIDMPLYGLTEVNSNQTIIYDDWVKCGNDYINYELVKDNRPIFLFGLSAGGMEAYHVACINKKVKGIIGMTFLDQTSQIVRNTTTKNLFWSYLGIPFAILGTKIGLANFKLKMSLCSKMNTLCNDKKILKIMLKDKTSGGNSVPLKFITTYMTYKPEIAPEDFDICPILLTQPELDRWTPLNLSTLFLNKIHKTKTRITILQTGGHYPVEEKAIKQLREYALEFLTMLNN